MIKNIREHKGIKQKDLALRLGISQSRLSKIENRSIYKLKVNTDFIEDLANELNICPISVFLYFLNVHVFCRFDDK